VIGRKGPQGWVEVILGVIMIAVPIVLTAQKRKKIREQEERDRAEREAAEKRNRETLAAYTAALDRLLESRDDASLEQLKREREALTVPNTIWSGSARRTLLLIAFDELKKRGTAAGAAEIAQLLAAGRLGESQAQEIDRLRQGFGIADEEAKAVAQFQHVREVTPQTLPKIRCSTQLHFQEYCIYETATDHGTLHVTNKRNLLEGKKTIEISRGLDVTVDATDSVITLKTDDPKKPLRLKVEEPVYAAAVLDAASQIDERPRGFA
jgi:hypothetical protein